MTRIIDKLVRLCALAAYALVGLGLRLVMARAFFLAGRQTAFHLIR